MFFSAGSIFLCVSSANAAAIVVPNFSFETGQGSGGVAGIPAGWTAAGPAATFHPNGSNFVSVSPLASPADGNVYAFLETGTANPGLVTLTSAAPLTTTTVGMTYTLTAAIGHRNFDAAGGRRPDDYEIELLLDGNPVASNSLSDAYINIASGTWVDLQTSFVAASAGNLTVRLSHSSDDTTFRQGAFDNIRVDEASVAIPEPSTTALLGLAGLVLIFRRR